MSIDDIRTNLLTGAGIAENTRRALEHHKYNTSRQGDPDAINKGLAYIAKVKSAQRFAEGDRGVAFSETGGALKELTHDVVCEITHQEKPDFMVYLEYVETTLQNVQSGTINADDSDISGVVDFFRRARDVLRARAAPPIEIVVDTTAEENFWRD